MLVNEVIERIETEIPDLGNRTRGAAELAELVSSGNLPSSPVAAFVLPAGLRPLGTGEAMTGAFVQNIDEVVSIVLVVRSAGDATGGKGLAKLEPLIDALIAQLCGWAPSNETGVFRLLRGTMLPTGTNGTNFYQLDIAIQTQIRNFNQ